MSKPDGYTVVTSSNQYVGAWTDRDTAELVIRRSPSVKGEKVVPFYLETNPAVLKNINIATQE